MTAAAKIAGVMGWPVEHSLSPKLHGYWLKQYGIDGDYRAYPVPPEDLQKSLKLLKDNNISGVNLTVPHKESALAFVDEIEPLARRIGAINTVIVRPDGTLYGRNTDALGFTQNLLMAGFDPAVKSATVLGAGGAARAGLVALLDMGLTDIRVVNRTLDKAQLLASELAGDKIRAFAWDDAEALDASGLLVNATSLGLKGQPALSINLDPLPRSAWVTDMVYAPLETDLLKQAKALGHQTVDGLGMLLHQARPAFQAFFGVDPEVTAELRAHVLGAGL